MTAATWLCLLLPLASTIVITLGGTHLSRSAAGWISTLTTFGSFAAACVCFVILLGEDPSQRTHTTTSWTWLSAGQYHFGLSLLTDQLSVMMMLIVSGVGGLIVAYSLGYMAGENEERRYFAYMSLFLFSMLLLVQGANLLLLLAGWGMVGLSSYLLIGFYQERPSAVAAAKKAFVMNAIGDATFALALFLLVQQTGTLNYSAVFAAAPHGGAAANLVALGLLGGALAKSAQIPLHTWLPDAMEGPTPVSALIHAATMVTAGVYLIVRCHPLFENAYVVQDLAAGLGAATLLMAGLIALVQVDIKRVIAYSTMSQIGYMFVGAGLGAYPIAMFHLMTHAFFKALLFLAAGLVIHAVGGEQDIRKLAGIGKLMPRTRAAFLVGSLALAGIFPFAGFFSKDEILSAALAHGWYGHLLYVVAMIGAFLTGLYAFRLFFIVFTGEPSAYAREHYHAHHGKEGPLSMRVGRVRARRAGDDRRLPAVGAALGRRVEVARPGRGRADRPDEPRGLGVVGDRDPARARRRRRRLGHLLGEARQGAEGAAGARAQVLLGRGLRRRLLPEHRPAGAQPARAGRAAADRRFDGAAHGGLLDRRPRARPRADRARPLVRARARGWARDPRRRLPRGQVMGPLTTILIVVPFAGALLVAIAPLTSYWLGALGALISLIEVGIWITAVGKFDFADPHLQFAQQHSWIPDLNVSYHVGMYAFSLWLVGMTVIVLAACVIYGWWVNRARARAYFSLMLVLTGSIVGVFTAQDLLLFYAFFEAMLIPLYILIGVWGGPRTPSRDDHVRRVHGRRIAADARRDRRVRPAGGNVRPDHDPPELLHLDLPRLRRRVRGQVTAVPVPRLALDHLSRVAAGGVGRPLRGRVEGRSVRAAADRDPEVPRSRPRLARGTC